MADPFTPKFVDLVRNFTMTTGTGNLVLGDAAPGFTSFTAALKPGDQFYYSVVGLNKIEESEVGRGTLTADGGIAREPINGVLKNFTTGAKSVALVATAEWFGSVDAVRGAAVSVASRTALAALAPRGAAVLTEAGREGSFLFDGSNLAQRVAADSSQAIYVPLSTDATGGSGAWVRQNDGTLRLKWFGAGGVGIATAAIQAALDYAGANGGLQVCGESGAKYDIDGTLNVPASVSLDWNGAKVNVVADVDGVRLRAGSRMANGTIETAVAGYSKALVYLNGIDRFNLTTNARVDNLTLNGPGTGEGIRLQVDGVNGDRIAFTSWRDVYINNFYTGLHINVADPGVGTNWANSNVFDNLVFYGCVKAIVGARAVSTSNSLISGNHIFAQVQPATSFANAQRALVLDGTYNHVRMMIWDWSGAGVADQTAVEFKAGRNYAVLGGNPMRVKDTGGSGATNQNQIQSYGDRTEFPSITSTPPMTVAVPVATGVQDDYLAFANKQSGWTVSSTIAVSTGSVNNIFDPVPITLARWNALSGSMSITVDMGATVANPTGMGVSFDPSYVPDSVLIERSADGVSWPRSSRRTGRA